MKSVKNVKRTAVKRRGATIARMARRLRFCLITTFFPPKHFGGDAIFVANLANLLVNAGHHVEVVCCDDSFQLLRGKVEESAYPVDSRVVVHRLSSPFGAFSPIATHLTGQPFGKQAKLKQILEQDFDVTHWHNLSLIGGSGALPLGKGVRLMTLHEYWLACPTSILFRDNEAVCIDRHCYSCTLKHGRPPQLWRSNGKVSSGLDNIDAFLAPSIFVANKYRELMGINPCVLPHFLTATAKVSVTGNRDYYLIAGRLEKYKGIQNVLPFFKENPKRRLKIAGVGNFEGELRRIAEGSPNIEFLGRIAHFNLASLYANARATLVPSICWETFGLTALESIQQSTPVVVSGYGALPEIVESTGGGWVVDEPSGFGRLLDQLDADPQLAIEYGNAGAAGGLSLYSAESHLVSYLALISS